MQQSSENDSTNARPGSWHRAVATLVLFAVALTLACSNKESEREKPSSKTAATRSRLVTNQKYLDNLPKGFVLPDDSDEVGQRVLADYGAVFVAQGGAEPPLTVMFDDEESTRRWQSSVKTSRDNFGGIEIELQAPAMSALREARTVAEEEKLTITPRGTDAARRSYAETVRLWQSRVNPGLNHWVSKGSLSRDEAERIRALSPREQVAEILELETDGLYFSTDFTKSILYSVAAPGTSQHLSMLAFDVKEHDSASVRRILERHGWFQTIPSDLPHFTYLGVAEEELPSLGLKKTTGGGRNFWIPQLKK